MTSDDTECSSSEPVEAMQYTWHEFQFGGFDGLTFAAGARCQCGAGLAYRDGDTAWSCCDVLTGLAPQFADVQHDDPKPFAFHEVKSERQPSADFLTTRPTHEEARYAALNFMPRRLAPYGYVCPHPHHSGSPRDVVVKWRTNQWSCEGCAIALTAFVRLSAKSVGHP